MALARIGTEHPHVAVHTLTVAKITVGSHQKKRRRAASDILSELKSHHEEIVPQAEFVAREVVWMAILCNIKAMLDLLLILYDELERGSGTPLERNFKADW